MKKIIESADENVYYILFNLEQKINIFNIIDKISDKIICLNFKPFINIKLNTINILSSYKNLF